MAEDAKHARMPVVRAVTFAAPHVGVRLCLATSPLQTCMRSHTEACRAQNATFVGQMETRGVQVLRVVSQWDLIPHVPGIVEKSGDLQLLCVLRLYPLPARLLPAGIMHVITAMMMLWLRRTPRYKLNAVAKVLMSIVLPW